MTFEKILKNPVAVVLLCLSALGIIYINIIKPLTSTDSDEGSIQSEISQVSAADDQQEENVNLASDTTTYVYQNSFDSSNWIRSTQRDPFKPSTIDCEFISDSMYKHTIALYDTNLLTFWLSFPKIVRTEITSESINLKAISVGKHGKKVVLGTTTYSEGDTCSYGIIKYIDNDSLVIFNKFGFLSVKFNSR